MAKPRSDTIHIGAQSIIAIGFAALILLSAFLLMLPVSSAGRTWTPPLTALFTAVSAVCVTGLVLVDTATYWSFFGQSVILLSIQIGALGVMTALSLAALFLGRRIGLRQRTLLIESLSVLHVGGIVRLLRFTYLASLLTELTGALLLSFRFVPLLGLRQGLWLSLFHAVSAFCNAGFDLTGSLGGAFSSLEAFAYDPLILLTLSALAFSGGLGFFVWHDLFCARLRLQHTRLHTRVVLMLTVPLLLIPAALFFFFERGASMSHMDVPTRLLISLFCSIAPRTAGFNAVPISSLSSGSFLLTLFLMFIGGNPGSTAGGAKATNVLILVLLASAAFTRREDICLFGRRLADDLLRRACALIAFYLAAVCLSALALCAFHPVLAAADVVFEVFSALSTVGLTAGITRCLGAPSLIILMLLMYAGRLGSLTLVILSPRRTAPSSVRLPADTLLIG
ncbi:MAG: Trk family potassium uptake protein [Clostridia bacterium]|nr:Trk family potassium uptake protein [Clostridia bacterium]